MSNTDQEGSEKQFRNSLTKEELQFLDEFNNMYDTKKPNYLYESKYFSEKVLSKEVARYNNEQKDIYFRSYRLDIDVSTDGGEALLYDLVSSNELATDSVSYTAYDYVRNPFSFSEDILVRLIDKQAASKVRVAKKQSIEKTIKNVTRRQKMFKDLSPSDRYKFREAEKDLKSRYRGKKLKTRLDALKRRFKIDV